MTTIVLDVRLAADPASVYDDITRPARWKLWHPASLGADAVAEASLPAGARFGEEVRAAGFRRQLRWQVEEADPPRRWMARATMADGSLVHLLYELAPEGGGTRLKRTLSYAIHPRLLRWANDLLLWRRVEAESRRALDRLARRFAG